MSIKLKNIVFINGFDVALATIVKMSDLPAQLSWDLSCFQHEYGVKRKLYLDRRDELMTKYWDKNEDGTPAVSVVNGKALYQFTKTTPEDIVKMNEKLEAHAAAIVKIPGSKIPLKIAKMKSSPAPEVFTALRDILEVS